MITSTASTPTKRMAHNTDDLRYRSEERREAKQAQPVKAMPVFDPTRAKKASALKA